ncbi:helix-turn-helix domain-containing protein [Mycobacterium barrassiae]|uniref:IclR family transcriptional regulator n=1 Tax=Mycobacterium barrassiae TaxID=319709 RepID=UPI002265E8BE|nr:IclR family transcriptional regulator C-terminal domain-containing protein [Mycobacterium barrassiae]MCV7302159.1 helix-turn-helix domain-containing protein [Mycobacterium barrassiae]
MADDHTVVGRAVTILDTVVESAAPITLAELTRRTGIPKQTVRRIANDLVARGMLDRAPDGYAPGQRLMRHGMLSAHRHGIAVTAQPYLQELHLRTRGQAAWFATVHGGELMLAGAAFGRSYMEPMAKSWFPNMSKLGPSRVLLAAGVIEVGHHPELVEGVLTDKLRPLTRHSVTDTGRLRQRLREVRDTGYAYEAEQAVLGVGCTAAAVREPSGKLVGAIGVTGRRSHPDARGLRNALLRFGETLLEELKAAVQPRSAVVWNTPMFNQSTGIGYTWPGAEPPAQP